MIEVHNDPANALSDGGQSLKPQVFDDVMKKVKVLVELEERKL
jgi:3-deoxy-7-phosphoheptulonate synthase